jgi:hypothetical protein
MFLQATTLCHGQCGSIGPVLQDDHDTSTNYYYYYYYYYHLHYLYGLKDKIHYIQKLNDTERPHHLDFQYAFPRIWGHIFEEQSVEIPFTPADHILG